MNQENGKSKADAAKRLSTLAMLVDCLIKYEHITSTKELAIRTGRHVSQIRKAKQELTLQPIKYARADMSAQIRSADQMNSEKQTGTLVALNTESPTEISYLLKRGPREDSIEEIPGLNGSTTRVVKQLAAWMDTGLGVPDLKTSYSLLQSNTEVHGPEKVLQGMLDIEALIASGDKPRNILKTFATYIKNAIPGGKTKAPKESFYDQRRRETFELLESMGALDEQAAH